ncbi:MAG: L-rhamnose isomerase [Bacillati bacterium ANGP1]|uniref:L-rhamnose isomerase n=1 Tax=Candidatus Segetimicrobium genomatis TaxID=2569760 RepID=A0A537KY07_9BACT|nr:MAG: L-rhamnose isomerase [Terrabacteria group bacterium ANGP1]
MEADRDALKTLAERGSDVQAAVAALTRLAIETPSWGYGNSGTRFAVFPWPGAARTVWEKVDDAALVHRLTGICPSVAIHIPWDRVDDWQRLVVYAAERGVRVGAVNPNVFQDDVYRLGSVCHPDPAVRRRAVAHLVECVQIAKTVGSNLLSLWFADGTNYAGQDDLRTRRRRLVDALAEVYATLPPGMRMLIEYKFFEPAFYHTDLADWGMASAVAARLGPQAEVLVDLGHHAPGTNIEHIVACLLDEGRLGGFHFNNRRYADDDLIVGSVNPFELFMIFHEILSAECGTDPRAAACAGRIAYMIDQSHNVEGKIEPMLLSVANIQAAYAKALLVDRRTLAARQTAGDVLGAHQILLDAYHTDVRPLLRRAREELRVPADPLDAFRREGHAERLAKARGAKAAGAGYPGA